MAAPQQEGRNQKDWGLFDLTHLIESDLSTYLRKLTQNCADQLGADDASLFLSSGQDRFRLECTASERSLLPPDTTISRGEGVAGRIIEQGQPRIIVRLEEEEDLIDGLDPNPLISSSMIIPLISPKGARIGVLNLSRRTDPVFGGADLDLGVSIASQAALAITNAQLVKEKERADNEAQEMARMAEFGRVAAKISHELRNPLTGIIAAAQLISSDPDSVEQYAPIIRDEAIRMNGLCDQFLDLAKPATLKLQPASLGEVATCAAEVMAPALKNRNIDFQLKISPDLPKIELDTELVHQSILNLLKNSLEACSPGDAVELSVTELGLDLRDTGPGMSEEALETAFRPFATSKVRGTGLGLSMVQKVTSAHGWKIAIETPDQGGTIVRVRVKS